MPNRQKEEKEKAELRRRFEFLGIVMRDWPDMVGQYTGKRLIICAGARCVWDDIAMYGVQTASADTHFMAVNDVIMHLPMRVEHAYSNDHGMLEKWVAARRPQYVRRHKAIPFVHSNRAEGRKGITSWPWPGHGTSALGATYTAIALGYSRIVLCGAPLDNQPSYFSPPWEYRNFENEVPTRDDGQMAYWNGAARRCFIGRVKSMSGRTRDLLGSP